MSIKDIKSETRQKLALNMHQAIIVYAVEFVIFITLLALVSVAAICIEAASGSTVVAAAVMIAYGVALMLLAITGFGIVNYGMIDHYLTSYKCNPYNFRRLGDVISRNGIIKIFKLNIVRTLLGFLLSLLLIVPGVIYLVRTSMANHLLIANPKMKPSTALQASSKVMSGKTGLYFGLVMSFFGWYMLGILTLGIGFIFILPYVNLAKTVYYKRNLQGDKTVFGTVIQPQTLVEQPDAPYAVGGEPVAAAARPVMGTAIPEDAVAPIGALGVDDINDMNEAMRDLGASVPEVAINATVGSNNGKRADQAADVVVEPITPIKPVAQSDPDSNFVEIVTPLTTLELEASDEIERSRIDALYSGGSAQSKPKRDYISRGGVSNTPDDFVDSFDDPMPLDVQPAVEEPVMSDAEFDAFLRDFDEPKPESEPLRHASSATEKPNDARTARPAPSISRPERPARVSPRPQAAASGSADPGESRADRIRREREERIQKLRNSTK